MLVVVNILWLVAVLVLMGLSKRFNAMSFGPYTRCPRCLMWYQACEPICPSCCMDDHPPVWSGETASWNAPGLGHDAAAEAGPLEYSRVNASDRAARMLRYLVIARIVVVVVMCVLAGLCIQTSCAGFETGKSINTLGYRHEMFVLLIGWYFYELAASCYLLGDGGATRQGPGGSLVSLTVRELCRGRYGDKRWWISGGRWQATFTAVLVYMGFGVVSLVLLVVSLYFGIFPTHPVIGGIGQLAVTLRVLGIAVGMYVMNIALLLGSRCASFLVERPCDAIPEGGWRGRGTRSASR